MVRLWWEDEDEYENNKIVVKSDNEDFPIVKTFPYEMSKKHPATEVMKDLLVKIGAVAEEKMEDFIITEREIAIEDAKFLIFDFYDRVDEIMSNEWSDKMFN